MLINFTVKSVHFKVGNNDFKHFLLPLLLSLNIFLVSFILFDIFWNKLFHCFICYYILCSHNSANNIMVIQYKNFVEIAPQEFCFLYICHVIDQIMTQYTRIGVYQLPRFKSDPSHGLESTLVHFFSPSHFGLFFTFCNFFINLALHIYHILSLLTCFSIAKALWITSPWLITMFLLFIHISYDGQLRKILIQEVIVCSDDNEVNPASKIKSLSLEFKWFGCS